MPAKEAFPKNVIVRANENRWTTGAMVEEWVKIVWQRHLGALFCKNALVVDSYPGHLTDGVTATLAEAKTDLAVIPGGMTGQLQPLDSINKPFKDRLRKLYTDWLTEKDHQLTATGRIKRAPLSQVAAWVAAA